MKKTTKILALVLTLAMVLSLAACAGSAGITGSWKYNMDMPELMKKSTEASASSSEDSGLTEEQLKNMADTFAKVFDGINMVAVLDLKDDNSFKLSMDEASVKAATEALSTRLPDMMPDLLAAMFGTTTDKLDDMLAEWGTSVDDMMKEMEDEFSPDAMLEDLDVEDVTGTYRYEEGKLILTPKAEEGEESKDVTLTVELNGNELKVTALDGEVEDSEMYKALLPLVFTR